MFDTMLKRDLFAEFHSPSTPIGEIAHKLFDKIAKRSKCFAMLYNVYRKCSFLYSLDGVATSTIKPYIIDQLRYVELDCKRIIDALHQRTNSALVARKMVDALGCCKCEPPRQEYAPFNPMAIVPIQPFD